MEPMCLTRLTGTQVDVMEVHLRRHQKDKLSYCSSPFKHSVDIYLKIFTDTKTTICIPTYFNGQNLVNE